MVTDETTAAFQGTDFGFGIMATNSPTSFAASNLPDGLAVNPLTGTIYGTPAESGTFTIGLSATNSAGTGTATLILKVVPEAPMFNSSMPGVFGQAGQPFTYQIMASNRPTSYGASRLPAGLSVDASTGIISGTPTVSGSFTFNISATNIAGTTTTYASVTLVTAPQVIAPNFEVLQSFGPLGAEPLSPVILGSDGNIYGATSGEESDTGGTVYKITPAGVFTNLYTFTDDVDGFLPTGGFIQANDGNFYGAAALAGGDDGGTAYEVTPSGAFNILHTFTRATGYRPESGLTLGNDGNFYGTTSLGSFGANGTIYQITPTGVFTTLHTFTTDEGNATAGVILGSDGNLYGTTSPGIYGGYGTVFKMTLAGGITTLYNFTGGAEGADPVAGLIQGNDGNFYGTTAGGVQSTHGAIFKITPGGALTTLHTFTGGADGSSPTAALIQGNDGNFYGTTSEGGKDNDGTIFEITPAGVLHTLYRFSGADGANPGASVTLDNAGNLYGTTAKGGQYGKGVVFRLTLPASPVVTLAATVPQAVAGSGDAGVFTLSLSAPQSADLVISYMIKGTAINGVDYQLIKASKKIKAGRTSKNIRIVPQGDLEGASKKAVTLVLNPGNGYTIGTTGKVKVEILSAGQ